MKESNPIQQRMDLLVEKWEAIAARPNFRIIRIHAQGNEKDMVDSFYTYLLGVDTPNNDIPVIFESIYYDDIQYTKTLLDELKSVIDIWNAANKDALTIETKSINWMPDYQLYDEDNAAYTFVENMNRFAEHLDLEKNIFLVAILKASFVKPEQFCKWLEFALKAGIHEKVKILIDDSAGNPCYEKIALKYPDHIATLRPQLDMDNAMQQVAAMGNPNDPGVQYRQAFMKLIQAIEKRQEDAAKKHAAVCIEIAEKNLIKNAYWIGQVIAVFCALANDQVGYKNFKKAIVYASKGVEAAEESQQLIEDEFIQRKFRAQAIMTRAALYAADKRWQEAIADFSVAAEHYVYTNDIILAIEALRMVGYSNNKEGSNDAACKALADALQVAKQIPPHLVRFTTFAGVVELLLQINNSKYISQEEVQENAEAVYGEDWLKEITNWKNPHYEQVNDPSKVVFA